MPATSSPDAVTGRPVSDATPAPISSRPGKWAATGSAVFGWNSRPVSSTIEVDSQCCSSSGNRSWSGLYSHLSRYWLTASPMTSRNDSVNPVSLRDSSRNTIGV